MAIKKGEGTSEVVYSRVTIPRWGENITGWLTRTQEPSPAVLISPFAWGITGFIQAFSHRLTRQGWTCLTVEPYSRGGQPKRSVPSPVARATFRSLPPEQLDLDLRAGLEFLRKSGYAHTDRMAGLAFGDGGPALLDLAAAPGTALRGVALIGSPLLDGVATRVAGPVLGIYAANDEAVPADRARAFAQNAASAGHPVELLVYPGAGENFLDDERDSFEPASADDAWARITAFLTKTIGG